MVAKTKQIMVLRHAKAEAASPAGDFARSLTDSGRQQATDVGAALLEQKLIPQTIYTSTAKRALETAERVCEQLAIDKHDIAIRDELYLTDTETFLSLLHNINKRINRVLIVGHNPALEDLVEDLSHTDFVSDQPNGKRLLPASMVLLEFDGDWTDLKTGSCELKQRLHGKLLKKH